MSRLQCAIAIAFVAWLTTGVAAAHDGVQHEPDPASGAASEPKQHVLTASSARYEVVVKHMPIRPGKSQALDLYLSDFTTNAPIQGARVSLGLFAPGRAEAAWKGEAQAGEGAGAYVATISVADTGQFNLLVTLRHGIVEDRFALPGIVVQRNDGAHGLAAARRPRWFWFAIAALAALLLLLAGFVAGRAGRARRASTVATLSVLFALASGGAAVAHEGHGEPPTASGAPVGPGAEVYMAKESQFLLEVRTVLAVKAPVQRTLSVLGRVAPRNGAEVELRAPQSGRIYFPGGRLPALGERVRRGEVLAVLVVVDSLRITAPVTGIVTSATAANGQLVEAGRPLLTLLDPSLMWVHADVFERDLATVERSTRATVASQASPDLVLPARRVAIGATLGEVPGTVEAWFEVPNRAGHLRVGMLVDVAIEIGSSGPAIVIPRSAVAEKDGKSLVFVHTQPERFVAREVRITANLGDRVAIEGDVAAGDRVVVSGGYQLLTSPVYSTAR